MGAWLTTAALLSLGVDSLPMISGTSWGGIAFPGVYTSYDYGASVSIRSLLTVSQSYFLS